MYGITIYAVKEIRINFYFFEMAFVKYCANYKQKEAHMKILKRLLILLLTSFLFLMSVGAEEPINSDEQQTTTLNAENLEEETNKILENGTNAIVDGNNNKISENTENTETAEEGENTTIEAPTQVSNPSAEEEITSNPNNSELTEDQQQPELGNLTYELTYNEDHTIATVTLTYEGECEELTIANQEGIQELVNIGVYQVDMERSDWVKTIVFNILLNGAFHFDINVWSAEDLIRTGTVVGYITGLNNDALVFEPNQTEQSTYTTVPSDVGVSDSQSLEISYVTNVSYTWTIPTSLELSDIRGSLPITINNSNLAPETALRVKINTANGFNLSNAEVTDNLSYIVTDNNGNRVHDGDVILDHLFNQDTSSNTLNVDITRMPVYSGEYNDTWTFTASVERLLSDLYSGQVVTINQLGTTHKLIDMKIYGISKQDGTPSPDNPIEIQRVVNPGLSVNGNNLINPDRWIDGKISETDGETIELASNYKHTDYIRLSNTSISILCSDYIRIFFYDINKNYISNKIYLPTTKQTDSCPINTEYVRVHIYSSEWSNESFRKNIMLANGDVDFSEYQDEQTATLSYTLNAIPVSEGGNVIVNGQQYISDYIDIDEKKLFRMVGEVDLGALSWVALTGGDKKYYTSSLIDNCKGTTIQSLKWNLLCEKYKVTVQSSWSSNSPCLFGYASSYSDTPSVVIADDGPSTLEEFVSSINGYLLYYELETPTTINLSDEEVQAFKDLYTYTPTTAVSVSSNQLTPYMEFGLS